MNFKFKNRLDILKKAKF